MERAVGDTEYNPNRSFTKAVGLMYSLYEGSFH